MTLPLPSDDPLRVELNDEVHARPSEILSAPLRLTFLAIRATPAERAREWECVSQLVSHFGVRPPASTVSHFSADCGVFRLKWERHSEFTRYKFIVPGIHSDPFEEPAITAVPAEWIKDLPGQLIVAVHGALVNLPEERIDPEGIAAAYFGGNGLVGSAIAGGAALALTDFRIHADRFSRLLVLDRSMTPRQAGRMVQRLLEIETYRIMALLALPISREISPVLSRSEQDLAKITAAIADAREEDEPTLLADLTRLEADISSRQSRHHFRFSASAAYYRLVQRRIVELREERIPGLQTFQEFMERRLAPAMDTCQAAMSHQQSLSDRVARATQLLSTKVDITREQQTHAVLESMNRRARLQLRLQETVEGLSAAAVTYYVVGLIGYLGKGLKSSGVGLNVDALMAISIPVVAVSVVFGVRRIRRMIARAAA